MESLSSGHGIQVVTPSEDHTFLLDEEALQKLLLREDVRDRPVVLVSVAGAYRKGKSFLLDFFLRYLDRTYNNGEGGGEWLGKENETLKGFSWRGGSDRHTTGIHLWSQPFKASLSNGEKVVVLLMDTQGTFDSNSTVKDNATVFALSTMLSSVQIYNLSQNIEEDDLQHLQLFMEYGRVAKDEIGGKPFQRLQFLVRDWSYPYDHPYGATGGEQLLKKRLTVREGQHEELQRVRQDIARCFEDVTCFLMPYPGSKVSTDPQFSGKLSDIDDEFKSCLKQLVPMLLAPENLVTKKIGGQTVKARDLLNYFKSYVEVFNSEELPNPMTILQATAEANNTSASSEARSVYETLMEEVCGGTKPYLSQETLDEEHKKCLNKALHAFDSKKKMGGAEMADKFKNLLVKDLEELFKQLSAHNEGKNLHSMLNTPLVFVALLLASYLLSVVGDSCGLQTLVALGQVGSMAATAMLLVWLYTRWTGNGREIGMQLDDIAVKIKSSLNFEILRELIAESAHIIEDKSTKTSVNMQKIKEWKNIRIKFNEISGKCRSDGELKLAWKRMKLSAKSNLSTHRRDQSKTGGGDKPPSPSPEDLKIMAIAPHDFVIEVNDFDSDALVMPPKPSAVSSGYEHSNTTITDKKER